MACISTYDHARIQIKCPLHVLGYLSSAVLSCDFLWDALINCHGMRYSATDPALKDDCGGLYRLLYAYHYTSICHS